MQGYEKVLAYEITENFFNSFKLTSQGGCRDHTQTDHQVGIKKETCQSKDKLEDTDA